MCVLLLLLLHVFKVPLTRSPLGPLSPVLPVAPF